MLGGFAEDLASMGTTPGQEQEVFPEVMRNFFSAGLDFRGGFHALTVLWVLLSSKAPTVLCQRVVSSPPQGTQVGRAFKIKPVAKEVNSP